MHTFIVRAALRDEANEGWIWTDGFPSRTVVKITNCDGEKWFFQRRCVVCEVREFDRNFFAHYNKDRRLSVPENSRQPTVVLSHWYRSALVLLSHKPESLGHSPHRSRLL